MGVKEIIGRVSGKLPKSKSGFLIVVGLLGLILVLISSFGFDSKKQEAPIDENNVNASADEEYTDKLEKKIEGIISDMLGNTPVKVMITLESGTEYIYADEIKTDADVTKDQSNLKVEQSDSNQRTYIIVKDSEGNEKPLIVTEKMPVIRGVVIVCASGETSSVASAVRLAVKSALNVSDDKICIIGRHI